MKFLKWLIIVLVSLFILGFIALKMISENKPTTNPSPEADVLANKILKAINKPAWDTLRFLQWEFPGGHKYEFDKLNNKALIAWGDNVVNLNLSDQTGTAKISGVIIEGNKRKKLIQKAWSLWCNDSFWMFAPFKLFDPNTSRSIVKHNEKDALLITYGGGGVTPGDSYLWILGDDYVPTSYKMWVKIIPVGGIEFTWDRWITLTGGEIS